MESILIPALIAFIIGYIIAWAVYQRKIRSQTEQYLNNMSGYVKAELYQELKQETTLQQQEVIDLSSEVSRKEEVIVNLQARLQEDEQRLTELQQQFKHEFQNLANRLFEEKSRTMSRVNAEKLEAIIKPFDEKIQNFGKRVEETYLKGTQERSTLKEQLRQLMAVNNQLSQDAIKLTEALKGDAQFQGSWGEIQLKRLLEKAGLDEGVHFSAQDSMRDSDGSRFRTDFIIHLPEGKHLILDSKVSMVAFEQYFNSDTEEERQRALDRHLISVRNHIKTLSEKNYPALNGINPPDYVLMFMPLEPAFIAAVQADPQLYESALEKNIAIVSASTLMATLRTIAFIWKSENQTRNVIEIAKEAGSLYDKFVGFLDNMQDLGRRLESAQKEYNGAMNKRKTSSRAGSTLIGKVEKLRELGATATKRIPNEMLEG